MTSVMSIEIQFKARECGDCEMSQMTHPFILSTLKRGRVLTMKSRCWQNDARRDAAVAASRCVFPPPQRVSPVDMRFRAGQQRFGRISFASCGICATLQLQALRLQAARRHCGALNSMRHSVSKLTSPLRAITTRSPGLRELRVGQAALTAGSAGANG